MTARPRPDIIVAQDFAGASEALRFVEAVEGSCDFFKVGLELFSQEGPAMLEELRSRGMRV